MLYFEHVTHALAQRPSGVSGFITRIGQAAIDSARAVSDISTWGPLLIVQMRRLGVDSIPIALFIAVFTGIVLALLSSYIFTGAVPRVFVGALVGRYVEEGNRFEDRAQEKRIEDGGSRIEGTAA